MEVNEIVNEIKNDDNKYYDYSHFDVSNMADYTIMSETINELSELYDINPVEAVDIVQVLTH
jgi:hypothetical protein